VRNYIGTHPCQKALRKRKVWIEPLFAEAKDWHGMRKFRLRKLEKVNIEALLIASGQRTSSGCCLRRPETEEAGSRGSPTPAERHRPRDWSYPEAPREVFLGANAGFFNMLGRPYSITCAGRPA
jgi:hypothetical protein